MLSAYRQHPRIGRALLIGITLLIPATLLSFCVGPPSYYRAKYASAGPAKPTSTAMPPTPDKQVEAHTCGFHAMSSVYRAYGLDPDALLLRFRLGVDKPFTNLIPDSTGTIHPDMLRVLRQDGFEVWSVDPQSAAALTALTDHLNAGQLAIALIRAPGLHWVVIGGHRPDHLIICDSLKDAPYEEQASSYLSERVYSLLLVEPK